MISYRLIQGDSYEILRNLASQGDQKKYRLIITSPPYYNHRHYGVDSKEIGQEQNSEIFIGRLANTFAVCKELLAEDGSLWIVIGDTRRRNGKLMIPHRLALRLVDKGYRLREDIIWYKKNSIACSSRYSFSQAYEVILFLSKNEKSFTNMHNLRIKGNEARDGRNKMPPPCLIQY
ncbi:MAG: site-specific DNA-methyltransferase, partial [Thermoproteota archaeon]|nr:site-specific DNA-methyltransferase [Thermoproteota archaeon]